MDVIALPDGTFDTTTRDDVASVCGGTPSTMTGIAEAPTPGTIVIAQPVYVCDDGSEAQSLSGPPLEQLLRDLSFVHDPVRDELQDSFGMIWTRVEEAPSASPCRRGDTEPDAEPGRRTAHRHGQRRPRGGDLSTQRRPVDVGHRAGRLERVQRLRGHEGLRTDRRRGGRRARAAGPSSIDTSMAAPTGVSWIRRPARASTT